MGKSKFVFDNKTGTLKAVESEDKKLPETPTPLPKNNDKEDVVGLDLSSRKPNVTTNENVVQFRENSDYTIFQVTDDRSRKPMMVIAGYGLEIKFNMAELRSTEKIEQLLGGLTSMFRKMILEQALKKTEG